MCDATTENEESIIAKLIWIENLEGFEPTEDINEQIFDLVCDNEEAINEQLDDTGSISMFGEVNDWFIRIEIGSDHPDHVLISHMEQDPWLDAINESKTIEDNE